MKKNSINLFAAFVLAVFAGTIIYFGNTIHTEYKTGLERSEKLFAAAGKYAEENPEKLKVSMFSNDSSILSAGFTLNGNNVIFAYPSEEISSHVTNSTLVKVFNKTIVKDDDVYELKMAIYLLRPEIIFKTSRNSFIVILAATLISIALLIVISSKDPVQEAYSTEDSEESFSEESSQYEESFQQDENTEEPVLDNNFQEEAFEETVEETAEENADQEMDEETEENEDNNVETDEEKSAENPYYNQQKVMEAATAADDRNEGQREIIDQKVNFQLSNAASNEQDLSLFLIKLENTTALATAQQYLSDNYGKDNVYIFNENTFALLKENATIDEAEDVASEIEHNLKAMIPEADCYIGISSRSIRMLSSERLIMEAEEALNHTGPEEDSHIIGFHVDIEKYREFLKNS